MIKNDEGLVAVRYHQATSLFVPSGTPDFGFLFQVQNNVSIAWVEERRLGNILNMRANCLTCPPNPYTLAEQSHVDQWNGNSAWL